MNDRIVVKSMILGMASTNTYYVFKEGNNKAIIIDPADYGEDIITRLTNEGVEPEAILLTHGHADHIMGCNIIVQELGIPIYAHENEKRLLTDPRYNLSTMMGRTYKVERADYLKDKQIINIAGINIKVIATPGHTEGSCCYYIQEGGILFSGDTLFQGSIGRTDLPTGSMGTLQRSISDKIMILPDSVLVYPGHEEATDIGTERRTNPFCR